MKLGQGTVIGEQYLVERRVGAGAMGEVWAGRRIADGAPVALKVLLTPAARDSESLARFRREAQILSRVRSEYVSHVLDFLTDDEFGMALVMELVPGDSLHVVFWREKKLPLEIMLPWASDILHGLRDLHSCGVVHRDLKPGNIIARPLPGARPRATLIDFGVGRVITGADEEELTRITRGDRVLGTLEYMAPEQILGSAAVTFTADLYALGALMFRGLAGQHVFGELKEGQLALAKLNKDPVPLPLGRDDELATGTRAFVARLLSRRSRERFESTEQALAELEAILRAAAIGDEPSIGGIDDAETMLFDATELRRRQAELLAAGRGPAQDEGPLAATTLRGARLDAGPPSAAGRSAAAGPVRGGAAALGSRAQGAGHGPAATPAPSSAADVEPRPQSGRQPPPLPGAGGYGPAPGGPRAAFDPPAPVSGGQSGGPVGGIEWADDPTVDRGPEPSAPPISTPTAMPLPAFGAARAELRAEGTGPAARLASGSAPTPSPLSSPQPSVARPVPLPPASAALTEPDALEPPRRRRSAAGRFVLILAAVIGIGGGAVAGASYRARGKVYDLVTEWRAKLLGQGPAADGAGAAEPPDTGAPEATASATASEPGVAALDDAGAGGAQAADASAEASASADASASAEASATAPPKPTVAYRPPPRRPPARPTATPTDPAATAAPTTTAAATAPPTPTSEPAATAPTTPSPAPTPPPASPTEL